ncbi:hypothetical protein ACMD2_05039 [Ananas comosus]|uniref:Uncharacterized protein n=1 Tax=Ananas comosus TaxID=4615 RepID=A0A199V4P0_ANACO|nr:hypothetical protein ACMD2_05039 [Ananas comosus]
MAGSGGGGGCAKSGGISSSSSSSGEEDGDAEWRAAIESAKKLLDDLLENNIEIVRTHGSHLGDAAQSDVGGIKLFRKAPPGITLDTVDSYPRPDKKPRILPGEEIDEKSKKFRRQLQSVAIDGNDVIASAREASRKSLARFEAKEAAVKAAAKREEERVQELRRIRGEKWLPSIAREMRDKTSAQQGG